MAALAFDTLDASKTLRNAGVDERMAEAIVQIVQRTAEMPDISHLSTKEDLVHLATKAELAEVKGEIRRVKAELSAELSERLRGHTFAMLAYMTALVGLAAAFIKYAH